MSYEVWYDNELVADDLLSLTACGREIARFMKARPNEVDEDPEFAFNQFEVYRVESALVDGHARQLVLNGFQAEL